MRVLIVNTSEKTGGAALAANRLMEALKNNGVKAMMLVRDKETDHISVASLPQQWRMRWYFLWERWCVFCHLCFRRKHLFDVDIANIGADITKTREFQDADVIHLHWVNQGMLSLKGIRRILDSGKPVVWTMHDIWPATAICHYSRGCERFKSRCERCPLLPGKRRNDLSSKIWKRKQRMLEGQTISFVACSQWLASEARKSGLLAGQEVTSIPNAIDTRVFRQLDKQQARKELGLPDDKRLILFVSQRVTDERKGMNYLVEAVRLLIERYPDFAQDTGIVILGGHSEELEDQLALPSYSLGYVSDVHKIVNVYNAADAFVLPSLEDNLPNTIMEAMACGVPCVGFHVGGIPEMIDHQKNGYVARFRDADDLCKGLHWVLNEAPVENLRQCALQKVYHHYSQQSVSLRYIEEYNKALAMKNYKL